MILQEVNNIIQQNTNKNIIYHYAKDYFPELLTLSKQVEVGKRKGLDPFYVKRDKATQKIKASDKYSNHVSFFFDQLPFDIIANADFWDQHLYKQPSIYEYQVDIDTLSDNIKFQIKESSFDQFLFNFWHEFDNKVINQAYEKLYFNTRHLVHSLNGQKGEGKKELADAVLKFKNVTRDAFYKLVHSKEFTNDIGYRRRYATNVPHLMIFVPDGIIKPIKITKVNLDDFRTNK
jgi:hypothetical protein